MLMKKKFIFLAMMLLTLLGGAKFNVLNAQTQYRVKFPTLGDYYLTIFNNTSHPSGPVGGVGVGVYQESNAQKFTIETGANGGVYLKSADGYYIYCNGGSGGWNVDAINSSDKSELYGFDMTGGSFKIYDDNGYIKVEEVNSAYYIFHNASSSLAASWQLEEVTTSGGDSGDGGDIEVPENLLTVEVGEGSTAPVGSGYYDVHPFSTYYNYTISQQIYTAEELGNIGMAALYSVAFKFQTNNNIGITRNISVYLKNISKESFSSTTDWISLTSEDMVYTGTITIQAKDSWLTLNFSKAFDYDGGNVLVCVCDNTGSYQNASTRFYGYSTNTNKCLIFPRDSGAFNVSDVGVEGKLFQTNNQIRFSYEAKSDDIVPAAPTNLVATAIDHKSISLTWTAGDENALKYNIYQGGVNIGSTTETSYTVEGLTAETNYCFTVEAVRGANISESRSNEACDITLEAPAIQEVTVGDGGSSNVYIPIDTYWKYSITQQIYTTEILGFSAGTITKISFNNITTTEYTRNIDIYMINTDKNSFSSQSDWVAVTEDDKVYSGNHFFGNGFTEIVLTKEFEYDGRNILICVDDNTGAWKTRPTFATQNTSYNSAIVTASDNTNFNPGSSITAASDNYAFQVVNQVKFTWEAAKPSVEAPESIALGNVRMGVYWSEKEQPYSPVSVLVKNTTITEISCDNDFFTLSTIDYNQNPIEFNVSYDNTKDVSGEQSGNITITYGDGETKVITVSATPYTPAQGDVMELAKEITFAADGSYTDNVTGMHDDYILPGEENDGNAPDAVYTFTLTEDAILSASINGGTNSNIAIYNADDLQGSGPSSDNNDVGVEMNVTPATPTTFFSGFETGDFTGWQNIDGDGDGNVWQIATGGYASSAYKAVSHSYTSTDLYPENYLITDQKYLITENSALTVCATSHNSQFLDGYKVMVSGTGEIGTFTEVEAITAGTVNNLVPYETDLSAYAGMELYIAINHYTDAKWSLYIDNVELTDGSSQARSLVQANAATSQIEEVEYKAGTYYLVAASDSDNFTLSVTKSKLQAPGVVEYVYPENDARGLVNPKLEWKLGKFTKEYQLLLGTTNPPTDVAVDWTSELAFVYMTSDLSNNTRYYWQVNEKNAIGVTEGPVSSFVTPLDAPQNIYASPMQIYEGDYTEIYWSEPENTNGFLYYNIYVNGELLEGELEDTYYEMWGLDHNVNGHTISVTAVYDNDLGESEHATCNVYVGGYTDITINVKNGVGDPLPNANVSLQYGYNEFNLEIPAYYFTTDENGQVNETVKIVSAGSPYLVTVSKALYNSATGYLDNGDTTLDITMELAAPSGLKATPEGGVFYGEPVTVTWDSYEYAENPKYHVWVNDVQHNAEAISDTSYVITDLPYDVVNGNKIQIQVEQELGKSSLSYPVYVTVAGKFIATFNVKDNEFDSLAKPIEGATVTIKNDGFVDQLGNTIPEYTITTDADGFASIALPLFPNSDWHYYHVEITKGLYNKYSDYITSYAQVSNGSVIDRNIVMTLPEPNNVQFARQYYFVGEDVVLTWEAPTFNNRAFLGYNIYQTKSSSGMFGDGEKVKINDNVVTATTYTVSGLEYGSYYFSVSAVYDEGESATASSYVKVTDYGKLVGTVVNAEGKALKDATISVTGNDEFGEEQTYSGYTTDRNGKFVIENILLSGWDGYTVKATKFDYIDYTSSHADSTNAYVEYHSDGTASEVTVVMQSNPAVSMKVEASDNDTVAAVTWDSPQGALTYTLYRHDLANDSVEKLIESIAENYYYDEEWPSLADGDYQYGVSAYVGKSWSFKESFTNGIPADWKTYATSGTTASWMWKAASVTKDGISAYDGDNGIAMSDNVKNSATTRRIYMVTSLIDLTEAVNPTMSFYYHTPYYNSSYSGTGYTNELKVLVLTEAQGQDAGANGAQLWTNGSIYTTWWTNAQIDLSAYQGQKIYIAFESTPKYGNATSIDYVEITADPEYYTSRINWSDPLVKGAIIYRGEGNWTTAANWSTGVVPTSTDDVTIKGKVTVTDDVEINSITIAKNSNMGMGYGEGEEYSLTLASGSVLTVTNGISNNNYSSSFIINDGAQVYQNYEGVEATFNMLIQNPTDWKDTLNKDGWQMIASPLKGSSVTSFVPADTDYDLYKYDGTKELQWVNHKYHANSGGSFSYNFENQAIPSEIIQIDSDGDGRKWGVVGDYNNGYTYTQNIVGSVACLYSESYFATANTDNYLVLPKSFVVEGSVLSFQITNYFSYHSYGYSEQYQVLVSETTPELAEFEPITDVLTTATSNNSSGEFVWEDKEYDLSAYNGKEIYIAIRHINNNDAGKSALVLDNIKLVRGEFDEFELEFEQGRAYLASYEWEDTATFTGTLNHETSFNFGNLAYNSEDVYNNFHLLGNPFSFDMDWANVRLTNVYNGYATVSYDGSYEYHTSGTIPVGDGFFVKTIGNNASVSVSNTRTRSAQASNINLIATGNEGSDNIIISFGGEEEEGFAKLDNLNENIAELYILNEGRRYGIKSYDEDVEEIEVKFAPKRMGSYTINAIAEGDFSSVILVDHMEGIETNLLLEGYTFMAREKDARDRFTIKLSKNGVQAGDDFVYQSGDELIINGAGTVQIIDVMGRIVYSSDVESCNSRINVSGLKSATYMVRNINGNEVKTQKIVVL